MYHRIKQKMNCVVPMMYDYVDPLSRKLDNAVMMVVLAGTYHCSGQGRQMDRSLVLLVNRPIRSIRPTNVSHARCNQFGQCYA